MDENQKNKIKEFYNDLMKLKETEIYAINTIPNKELFNNKENLNYIIKLCSENLKNSINILKNYSFLIFLTKSFGLGIILDECIPLYENDFKNYIQKLEKERGKQDNIQSKTIIIDEIPHKSHIEIRIMFLELIMKNTKNKHKINEFIINDILLPQKIFEFEDKKNFLNIIINKYKNQSEKVKLLNEILTKYENGNKRVFIDLDDVLFYEYLILELNYNEDYLKFKEKNKCYKIILIREKIHNLKHLKNFMILFYNQNNIECVNEMAKFLYKLYHSKNNIIELCLSNKDHLYSKNNSNVFQLFKCIIEEEEKGSITNYKSHSSLCKKNIVKISFERNKENVSFYFFGNTKISEIQNLLMKKFPYEYYEFYFKVDKTEKLLKESDFNKTLNEIKKNKIQLKIYKKEKSKEKIFENDKLTTKFREILEKWFYKFSKNKEFMDENDIAKFISTVTKKEHKPTSIKVLSFIRQCQTMPLNKERFINYFKEKCKQGKFDIIYDNIKEMDYYPDLTEIIHKKIDNLNLRYCLSNNTNEKNNLYLFDELKEAYDKSKLKEEIFDFILFLTTNIDIYKNTLNNFNSKLVKNDHLNNMYNLIIIESIFEDLKINDLKNEEKNKNIKIDSEKYLPFDSEKNDDAKRTFIINYIKNNYTDLIEYIIVLLKQINEEEKIGQKRNEIKIKCCIKSLEIINNIYSSYNTINFERENPDDISIKSPINIIKQNNLQNIIENNEIYKNLIEIILEFLDIHYLKYDKSINVNENDNPLLLLIKNCYNILFGVLFINKDILEYIIDNRNDLLQKIIINLLIVEKNEKNKSFIPRYLLLKKNENKISLEFLAYLIDLTFSIFDKLYSNKYKLENLFFLYFSNLCEICINKNYEKIQSKLLDICKKIYDYIKSKDNNQDDKEEIYTSYISILVKCLEKLKNNEKIKKDVVFKKIDNEMTLYDLFINKFILKEGEKIDNKKKEDKEVENLLSMDNGNKYLPYEEVIKLTNKNERSKKINDNKKENLIKEMISFCSWFLSIDNNKDILIQLILKLNEMKKIDEENGDILNIVNKRKITKRRGYVGIKNLSNICYFITVIQQLFMIPQFRFLLMSIDDQKPKNKTEVLEDDNMLHQLQRMFTFLLFSSFGDFIPKDFVLSLKKEDNKTQMISNIQQDSQEFYSNLCDSIEESVKNTKQKFLIDNFFTGTTCYLYLYECSNCGEKYQSYKYDDFKTLSLEVEKINSIYESLNNYISEEKIEDYKCEKCKSQVTLTKKTLISNLPNILIIHLKRIVMNFEEERPEKINSRFEFYRKLNLKDYCVENDSKYLANSVKNIYLKEDEYYEYELKGVNVHKGTAEGGHYISIIKVENEDKDEENDKWYQFDDSKVREFDINNMQKVCFGGRMEDSDEETNQCAYLLFYELSKKKPIKTKIDENEITIKNDVIEVNKENFADIENQYDITKSGKKIKERDLFSKIFYNKEKNIYYKYLPYDDIPRNISKEYLSEVIKENKILDYINGNNRIVDFDNYLLKIIIKLFDSNSFDIGKYQLKFESYKDLLDILIKSIISYLSCENKDEINNKNIVNIIKKIILPIILKNNFKENENSLLMDLINKKLLNFYIINNIFTNNDLKNIQEQYLDLLKNIISKNNQENNEILFSIIIKVINENRNLPILLYDILYEFIKIGNIKEITKNNEIFMSLYYKLFKENEENLKKITEILKFLIYEKKILKKEDILLKEIKSQFNHQIARALFDSSVDILILLIKQLEYKDKKFTEEFNINYIQKLFTYCEKNSPKINIKKLIKLILGILEIVDQFTERRIELLMGYPTLIIKKNEGNIIPSFGVEIMNNNINTEIFEYISYYHIKKDRCILSLLFPSSNGTNNNYLDENERLDLIYELIKTSLGSNKLKVGNYFLFKYIYLMQSRKIAYDNLYLEIKDILENANKTNNNKYDLSKLKFNTKKCIDLIEYETKELEQIINSRMNRKTNERNNYAIRPELPDEFNSCNAILNEKSNKDYYGFISNIIPDEIGKIYIDSIASNENLSILRFEYFTTYYTKKELFSLSEEKSDFIYEKLRRNKPGEDKQLKNEGNIIFDFSELKSKNIKNEKDLIIYIDNIIGNNDITIINKEIISEKIIQSNLIRYFILCKKKNTIMKMKTFREDTTKDIENNFYVPDEVFNFIKKSDYCDAANIYRIRREFNFLDRNTISFSFNTLKYDNYYNEYLK